MTHDKYLTSWFLEDNDPISAKSAAQILSLNYKYTFVLWNLLITSLSNSLASTLFTFVSDLIFLSKNSYTILANLPWYSSYYKCGV